MYGCPFSSTDFLSEPSQARGIAWMEHDSFVLYDATGLCGPRSMFTPVDAVFKTGGKKKNWKAATLQVFNFFAFAIQTDAPNEYICRNG